MVRIYNALPMRSTFEPVRRAFRAIAETILPETADQEEAKWIAMEETIEIVLGARPARMRRQIRLLVRALNWLPVFRYARRFVNLDPHRRTVFLLGVQGSRIRLLRIGLWGLRTMVFLGHYGRPEVAEALGYRADPRGWDAVAPRGA